MKRIIVMTETLASDIELSSRDKAAWWASKTPEFKAGYIKRHPNSPFAKQGVGTSSKPASVNPKANKLIVKTPKAKTAVDVEGKKSKSPTKDVSAPQGRRAGKGEYNVLEKDGKTITTHKGKRPEAIKNGDVLPGGVLRKGSKAHKENIKKNKSADVIKPSKKKDSYPGPAPGKNRKIWKAAEKEKADKKLKKDAKLSSGRESTKEYYSSLSEGERKRALEILNNEYSDHKLDPVKGSRKRAAELKNEMLTIVKLNKEAEKKAEKEKKKTQKEFRKRMNGPMGGYD
jgi:hypothetical protein